MPPKDITELGPLNWRELQEENKINNNIDDFWSLPTSKRVAIIKQRERAMLPIETLTENEIPEGFGRSRFDKDVPLYALDDIENWRAREQSGLEKIANGVIKGAITTGTTFVDILAGIPVGMLTAIAEGRLSGLWDNVVTNASSNITDWSEEAFPNYYTNEQRNSEWYSPVNLFSANFLGDKLIKNFGFSAGAGLGMKAISKIPKLLPKIAKSQNVARAINTAETSLAGAIGEGSIEALNGTKEWAEQNRNLIEQERSASIAAIDLKYSELEKALREEYGNTEVGRQLMMNLASDYKKEIDKANAIADGKVGELQNHIDDQGNLILAGNIPILWGSNILTLGKMIARGYGATENAAGKHVRKVASEAGRKGYESTLTSARQALRYAKTPFFEGLEEMNQAVISTAAKNRAQDYYNMAIDPDATEATKSYLGYIWDAFGQTYGDISNYEEFVIGMISSGISDIVVGQGKALRDERRQINDAVNRANDVINNFNNRVILQNMNRQQVLEDQKLDAALRNDKKDFKDSEFGQIASAVIAFSQIGKIEDLKAMLEENLSDLSNAEFDNLADELQPKDSEEPNFFKSMTYDQRRDYLKSQKEAYEKTIDNYNRIKNELVSQTGTMFTPEQQAELVFYKLRADNASKRINDINKDIHDYILNNYIPSNIKESLGLKDPSVSYSKEDIISAFDNFKGSNEALARIFESTGISQSILDRGKLKNDVKKFNDTVLNFIMNPTKLEEKNSKIRNKVNSIINNRKVQRELDNFKNINTFSDFSNALNNIKNPKVQAGVLNELIKQGNKEAIAFKDNTNFLQYVNKFLSESNVDGDILARAEDLILKAVDRGGKEFATNMSNSLYSREENSDLSDSEYNLLLSTIGNAVNSGKTESNEPITKESPVEKKENNNKESQLSELEKIIKGEDRIEFEDEEDEDESDNNEFIESTDKYNPVPSTVPLSSTVLEAPIANNNGNNTSKDADTRESSKVLDEKKEPTGNGDFLKVSTSRIDTKKDNPNKGNPVIAERDASGKLTKNAKEMTPIYNRLLELKAFDNVENGTVKSNSIIKFALDPTLKGDHVVEGETITYNHSAVLLYVDDKCVGALPATSSKTAEVREKLEEEFKDSSDNDIHISKRYYTKANDVFAGWVKFTKSQHIITQDDLKYIKERMSNDKISADEVVPIFTVFNPNSNAFERGTGEQEFFLGEQVSNIFEESFYKGEVVMLIPTAAYDSSKDIQPDHAFAPVRISRIRASMIDGSPIIKDLENNIRAIFKANQTEAGFDEIVGNIKQLITYNFHIGADEVSVHIDPCALNDKYEVKPITNSSYFETHGVAKGQGHFTYLRIKYKAGNDNVKVFTMKTHNGNVLNTTSLSPEMIDEYTKVLKDVFIKDLNSYVNVNKSQLLQKAYIDKLIASNALVTNVSDFRVIGDSFSMDNNIYDSETVVEKEIRTPEKPNISNTTEKPITINEVTTSSFGPDAFTDDDLNDNNRYRLESLRTTDEKIDIDKEVNAIMKKLPQLNKDEVFKVVKTLINVNDKGDKAMGAFEEGVIKIFDIAEPGTIYHEAFHLVFNMILTDKEVNALFDEYRKIMPNADNITLEERMAEDFRSFVMARENRSLSQRIRDLFKDIWTIVSNFVRHKTTFDTVAAKIWRKRYSRRELHPSNARRYAQEEYSDEMKSIKKEAIANGTFMKAPNDNPTNLNERQWLQVRTKAFKDWFGDWENDPTNSSKVVDENGEPLVVWHNTRADFNTFEYTGKRSDIGFHFGTKQAAIDNGGTNLRSFFLNIKKLERLEDSTWSGLDTITKLSRKGLLTKEDISDIRNISYQAQKNGIGLGLKEARQSYINEIINRFGKSFGIDYINNNEDKGSISYIVYHPNQIKSATDNIGTFSKDNDDIRYRLVPINYLQVFEENGGPAVIYNNHTYSLDDLSIERFQKIVDNNINGKYKNIVERNKAFGWWEDNWKALGVEIKATKVRNKFVIKDVVIDYNNQVIRDAYNMKKYRESILESKEKQCYS